LIRTHTLTDSAGEGVGKSAQKRIGESVEVLVLTADTLKRCETLLLSVIQLSGSRAIRALLID
jgi:hypothetical protein